MPVLVTVAWQVLSVRTFLKQCLRVFSRVSLVPPKLWHLPQVKNRMLLYTPPFFCHLHLFSQAQTLELLEVFVTFIELNPEELPPSHFCLCLSLTPSVFIFCVLTSFFFYLGVVKSLPNEVADGSILQGDRVERSPTPTSINLTASVRTDSVLSFELSSWVTRSWSNICFRNWDVKSWFISHAMVSVLVIQ